MKTTELTTLLASHMQFGQEKTDAAIRQRMLNPVRIPDPLSERESLGYDNDPAIDWQERAYGALRAAALLVVKLTVRRMGMKEDTTAGSIKLAVRRSRRPVQLRPCPLGQSRTSGATPSASPVVIACAPNMNLTMELQ